MDHPPVLKTSYSSLGAQPEGGRQKRGVERFPLCTQPEPKRIASADFDFFIWKPFKLPASLYDCKILLSCKPTPANCKTLPTCGRSGDADREGGSGALSPRQVSPPEGNVSHFSSQGKAPLPRSRGRAAAPAEEPFQHPLHPGWPCSQSPEPFSSAGAQQSPGLGWGSPGLEGNSGRRRCWALCLGKGQQQMLEDLCDLSRAVCQDGLGRGA